MKTVESIFKLCSLLTCILLINLASAQDTEIDKQFPYLSAEQKQILKEQQKLLEDQKAIFRANLSDEQRRVLNDNTISRQERTRMLRQSLTAKQQQAIQENKMSFQARRQVFRKTLTSKQKTRLRRFLSKKSQKQRRRILRRLRFLIQNNMD